MGKLLAIARVGLSDLLRHPLRSAASLACVVAVMTPYVAGSAVGHGLLAQAEDSVRFGADLYVSGSRFGRAVPVPLAATDAVRAVPGVRDAVPRIVGEVVLGRDRLPAVLVGIPADRLPETTRCVEGRLFSESARYELVVGSVLARRLGLTVGSLVPPFYRNESGERICTVVGLFTSDMPVWEANLVFCSVETAAEVFDQKHLVTDLLVTCEPGYADEAAAGLRRMTALDRDAHGRTTPYVTSREDLTALLPRGVRSLYAIFNLHFVLAFAVGIPLLMVTSGVGLGERRRESALMKAMGWMTDELLLKGFVESAVLGLLGASLSVLAAYAWLAAFDGAGIAGAFLQASDTYARVRLPYRMAPVPALLGFILSFAIVATGTLYSTWRAATARPAQVLR